MNANVIAMQLLGDAAELLSPHSRLGRRVGIGPRPLLHRAGTEGGRRTALRLLDPGSHERP